MFIRPEAVYRPTLAPKFTAAYCPVTLNIVWNLMQQ